MPATERKDVWRLIAKEKLQFIADRPIITRDEEPASIWGAEAPVAEKQ